jgi:hypothetical protein
VERLQPDVPQDTTDSAPAGDTLHPEIRALAEHRDGNRDPDRERRAKGLLERIAERHNDADVDLLDWFANEADVEPALREHAVGLLLDLGYPHALRVSSAALEAYRYRNRYRAPQSVPVIPLIVLGLYAFAELFLIDDEVSSLLAELFLDEGSSLGSDALTAGFGAYLATWVSSVLGILFLHPRSPLRRACQVILWAMWLLPILGALVLDSFISRGMSEWRLIWTGVSALLLGPGIAAVAHVTRYARRDPTEES